MTKYFMQNTHLAGLEAVMMLAPFFTRRYSGVMILNRFRYDSENTKCKYCTAYHKGKGCTEKCCPWLAERLEAGAVPYKELLKICFENLQNKRLKARLRKLASGQCSGWFYNDDHRRRFEQAKAALRINLHAMSPQYAAALFLLTADEQLWRIAQKGITHHSITFGQMKLRNISPDAYALYQTAKSLYTGKESITVAELADPELIDGPLLTTIVNGILVTRFGTDMFKIGKMEVYS